MQPLIEGTLTKAYYFSSQKPGELNWSNNFWLITIQMNWKVSEESYLTFSFCYLFNGLGIMRSKTVLKNVLALFCSLLCFRVGIHFPSIHRHPKTFESQHTHQLCYPCDDEHSLAPLWASKKRVPINPARDRHHTLLSSKHMHEAVEPWNSNRIYCSYLLQQQHEIPFDILHHHCPSSHSFGLSSDDSSPDGLQDQRWLCCYKHLG